MEDKFGNIVYKINSNTKVEKELYANIPLSVRPLYDEYDAGDIFYPIGKITEPTDSDYNIGYIWRYFYKQFNRPNMPVIEINKKDFNKASNHYLYKTIAIKWKIIGDKLNVENINKNIIAMANEKLFNVNQTLWNTSQFWKNIPDIISQPVDVTSKYVKRDDYLASTSLKIVDPVIQTPSVVNNYILSQNYVVILTQDYIGLLY